MCIFKLFKICACFVSRNYIYQWMGSFSNASPPMSPQPLKRYKSHSFFKVQSSLYDPFHCHNFQMNVNSAQVGLRSLIKAHNLNILQICICPSNRYTVQTAIEEQQHGYVTE